MSSTERQSCQLVKLRVTSQELKNVANCYTIATFIVHSKLDYCNLMYCNLLDSQINRLQKNYLDRVVTRAYKPSQITPCLKSLHADFCLSASHDQLTAPACVTQFILSTRPSCSLSSSVISSAQPPMCYVLSENK